MKSIKVIISTIFFAGLLTSCEDYLATTPYDSIDATAAFQTVQDLSDGANGVYGSISGQNIYEINALMTDELRRAPTNTGQGMQVFNHDIIPSEGTVSGAWSNVYITLDRLNRVLEAIDLVAAGNAEEEALKERIRGEMLGVRAYLHFDAYRIFVDFDLNDSGLAVPYMSASNAGSPARDNKGDYHTLLMADIDESINLLESSGFFNFNQFNYLAAQGLKARVALYLGEWQMAIDAASEVINSGVSLTGRDSYQGLWSDALEQSESEVLFKLPRLTSSDGTVQITERTGNEDIFFYASNTLADIYDQNNDIRFDVFFKDDGVDSNDRPAIRVYKYNQRAGQKNTADIKMMRLSEMYLIRAEAYARLGGASNLTNAAADVNELRSDRIPNPAPVSYGTTDAAISNILEERRRELFLEGHRFFDLKRNNLPVERAAEDIDGGTTSTGLAADDHRFVWPIPQSEMFANENMVQNPDY